jgi:hypothetical protein
MGVQSDGMEEVVRPFGIDAGRARFADNINARIMHLFP